MALQRRHSSMFRLIFALFVVLISLAAGRDVPMHKAIPPLMDPIP